MEGVFAEVSELDPVGYIRRIGLRPEDSYGFIPVKLEEGSPMLYLYRDRPEYEDKRATPAGPAVPMMAPESDPGSGMFGGLIEQAQELQRAYGGAAYQPAGTPGDPVPAMPDTDKLIEAAKLRASGAIDDAEYARLRTEAGMPDPGTTPTPPAPPEDPGDGPQIVAHRMYPGVRSRSSMSQLDDHLPRYCATVGLRPEDTYGVFPWGARTSSSTGDAVGDTEWDDYWVVYRDRPEYAAARDAYAGEMDDKGRWPEPVTAPGVGEPSEPASTGGEVEVDRERWPRAMLVIKQTGGQLADSVEEMIASRGYGSEDSLGFCPNFEQSCIYLGWRGGS